jgi:hypothetical protein
MFYNAPKQEPMRFDLGSMPQQPRALTTWARAASYMTSGTFHLKKSTQGGGAWKRGPAPKAQPHAHKTTQHDQALKSSWRIRFGGLRLFLILLLILAKLTSTFPNLVGFLGKREGKFVIERTGATGNHSSRFLGRFWVFSAFWSQWSRLQSQQRCRSASFRAEELEEPLGPWVKRSFIGAAFTVCCDFRVISVSVYIQILCLQQVWPLYWPFYHCNTILSINRARTCPLGALDPADVAQEG